MFLSLFRSSWFITIFSFPFARTIFIETEMFFQSMTHVYNSLNTVKRVVEVDSDFRILKKEESDISSGKFVSTDPVEILFAKILPFISGGNFIRSCREEIFFVNVSLFLFEIVEEFGGMGI